jgi:hypothetical protein
VRAVLLRNHKRITVFPPEHNSIRSPGMEIFNVNYIRVFAVNSHVTALLAEHAAICGNIFNTSHSAFYYLQDISFEFNYLLDYSISLTS